MKTFLLILTLAITTFAQVPQCTDTGQAFWTVTPYLSQIYGCAGGGKTEVQFMMQGFAGVEYLSAYTIELRYTNLIFNGERVIVGEPDSAGPGYRVLMVRN